MKRDGHIHTPFCPHGTKDTFEEYIEKALYRDLRKFLSLNTLLYQEIY